MSVKRRRRRTLIAAAILLVLVIAFSALATRALTPPRSKYGCMWRAYGAEPENSVDVLYLGTSVAYSNMIPAVIYRESGLTSFSMAGPVQTMAESYYYLRQALRTQHPSLVMLDISGLLLCNDPNYDFTNISYMPAGLNKLRCAIATAPASDLFRYVFPLYVYHSRWNEVSWSEIKENLSPAKTDPNAGWTMLTKVTPFVEYEPRLETYTEESFRTGSAYLRKIVEYCSNENVGLLLCMSPRCSTMRPETAEKLSDLLSSLDAEYVDFDTLRQEIGVDDSADFYDSSHLNVYGAEKFSCYLASWFTDRLGLTSRAGGNSDLWESRVQHYEQALLAARSKTAASEKGG